MKKIEFLDGNFDAVIVLNTKVNEIDILKNIKNCPILAADGAGINLLANSVIPDFIIGDLDSFELTKEYETIFSKENLIKISSQETDDFEKTLNFAMDKGYQQLLIIGIHGGDYEYSLNNWSVLSKYSSKLNITVLENERYGFCVDFSFKMLTEIDEKISLLPLKTTKISTNGLKWELSNEILELGIRDCARNRAIKNEIQISIGYGEIFVFCNSRFPKIRLVN